MIYTETTKKALKICFDAHKDQIDKSGMPYVFHPFHLAEGMQDEERTAVALLHDVIEDTDMTFDDLRREGFSDRILEAIAIMTHKRGVPYEDYVAEIKKNPIARDVKLADLRHNSDLSRLDRVTPRDLARVEKYTNAIKILENKN